MMTLGIALRNETVDLVAKAEAALAATGRGQRSDPCSDELHERQRLG